jgi:hypothetical protein
VNDLLLKRPWVRSIIVAAIRDAFLSAGGVAGFGDLVVTHLETQATVVEGDDGELRVVATNGQAIGSLIAKLKNERPRLFAG